MLELPPRLGQTLRCLLEGDSEKQVASRLGLSRSTIHEYVTALYRRLGVNSRPELMALCLRQQFPPHTQPATTPIGKAVPRTGRGDRMPA